MLTLTAIFIIIVTYFLLIAVPALGFLLLPWFMLWTALPAIPEAILITLRSIPELLNALWQWLINLL